DRDVERRTHRLPGLPDLIGVRAPSRIHDRTRGTDRGATAERARELFQHLEVGRVLETAAARDDDLRFRDVERARGRGFDLAHDHASGRRNGERLRPYLRRLRIGHEHTGAYRYHRGLTEHADFLQRLARVYGPRGDYRVSLSREIGDIRGDAHAEFCSDAWCEVPSCRRRGEHHRAVAARLGALRDGGGASLDAGRATYDRLDRTAEAPRRRHHLERHFPQHAVALLQHGERGHRTLASSRSNRTSSPTAPAPSPTIFPSLRSGGGVSATISTAPVPGCTGFTSSGFFFAAMMPLSAG